MARTEQVLVAVYRCCCAMALLQPGIAGMAVTAAGSGGGGGQQQQLRRPAVGGGGGRDGTGVTADIGGAVADDGVAVARTARNKRWSTTFGANSSIKNNNTVNNAVRECNTDSDCLDIPYTSCAVDANDRKKRCFCADGKQPLNGDCLKKPRALKTSCESDVECLPNAICKNNATSTNPRLKICMCKDGFTEEKDSCNYADLLTFNSTLLIAAFTTWLWNDRRVSTM